MATLCSDAAPQVSSSIAERTYYSEWFSVTQDQIDAFAAATGDTQWIHRADAERVASPFGRPIAHGLLLISLAITRARESGALADATWVLYGFDNLRFRAPVHRGDRIRSLTRIKEVKEISGRILLSVRFVMEIEDHKIPALVTDCLLLKVGHTITPHTQYQLRAE